MFEVILLEEINDVSCLLESNKTQTDSVIECVLRCKQMLLGSYHKHGYCYCVDRDSCHRQKAIKTECVEYQLGMYLSE
jgi:hypothetical protein